MPKKTILIAKTEFEVSAPFAEGQTISAAEAKVLNQTRAENIANSHRKMVQDALASTEDNALQTVRAAIAKYDAEYVFTLSNATRVPADPVAAEAQKIAREFIKGKLAEKGFKSVKEYLAIEGNEAKYDANIEKVSASDDVMKLARKRVADKKKIVDVTSEGLDL